MTGWYSVLINPGSAFACKGVGNLCVKPRCWKLELTQTAFKSTHIPAFLKGLSLEQAYKIQLMCWQSSA